MGSAVGTIREAVTVLQARGERVGVLAVRLYRPFDTEALLDALPATTTAIAVLDRTKEPGSPAEPLCLDVASAVMNGWPRGGGSPLPLIIGGRYGLSSKEFTPAMAIGVFDELGAPDPRREFTVGIVDDVTNLSISHDPASFHEPDAVTRAVLYGLGSDGTVGANKNSVKIVGERTPLHAQGYFVYDSKKSGSTTVSHLRFSPKPIESAYLIAEADLVAVHHFGAFQRQDVLAVAAQGAKLLINSPHEPATTWDQLPISVQQAIIDKELEVWIVDGHRVATEHGLGKRINTVLQTCFFSLTGLLPVDEAVDAIKASIAKTYGRRGTVVLQKNYAAVDGALAALSRMPVPAEATSTRERRPTVPQVAPDFVQRVTARIMAGEGDLLPVSAFPIDGTFPTATTQWEKRSIASEIPIWDPETCIDCARCALVCPHAAIRLKVVPDASVGDCPPSFQHQGVEDQGRRADAAGDHPGRARRLHRLRRLCRHLPGQEQGAGQPQGHQHGTGRRSCDRRTHQLRLLPESARTRPHHPASRNGEGFPDRPAPVRVLRRLRRLR